MNHIMLDLETWGTSPNSVIVAIGAVPFNDDGFLLPDRLHYYRRIDPQKQLDAGMQVSGSTLRWWLQQDEEARKEFYNSESLTSPHVTLAEFNIFVKDVADFGDGNGEDVCIWGNGATFDNVLLASMYETFEREVPWKFRNNRCYRTIKNLHPEITGESIGEENASHIAVEDARWQTEHLLKICSETGLKLN